MAVIYCVLCADNGISEKELTIQRHRVKGSKLLYWNFSNMYKHLDNTHNIISPKKISNSATQNKQTNGISNGVGKQTAWVKKGRTTPHGKVSARKRSTNEGELPKNKRKNDEIIIIDDDGKKSTRERATNAGKPAKKSQKNDEIIMIDDDSYENGKNIINPIVIDDDSDENNDIMMFHNDAESVNQIDIFECAIHDQISKQSIKLNKVIQMNLLLKSTNITLMKRSIK